MQYVQHVIGLHAVAMMLAATMVVSAMPASAENRELIVAGGCFWCVEKDFDHVAGVVDTVSGYSGGDTLNPTYQDYSRNGHIEVVKITYDANVMSFRALLDIFWRTIDVTDDGGQFCDRGRAYSSAVFVASEAERAIAEASKADAAQSLGRGIVTPVLDAARFWPAEEYHQNYYRKAPVRYNFYRLNCGRDRTVKALWGAQAYEGVDKD